MRIRHPIFYLLALMLATPAMLQAQEAAAEEGGNRVKYQFVRPDEKSPETVKPDEPNPFESAAEVANRNSPGDTEENRVRDMLLKLPVGGRRIGPTGIPEKIMLGDIMLSPGEPVPPLFTGQRVELRVKSISHQYIELEWQDKEVTGLPPKSMVIPVDLGPGVDFVMPGSLPKEGRRFGKKTYQELIRRNGEPQPPPGGMGTRSRQTAPAALPVEIEIPGAEMPSRRSPSAEPAPASPQDASVETMTRMLFLPSAPPSSPPPKSP